MIHKCALAVIERRGQGVIGPSMSPIDADEESFLHRHVTSLRQAVDTNHARGKFRTGSFLLGDLRALLTADDATFLAIADRHASALAAAMERTGNAKACVMALLIEGSESGANQVSLLKLDAEVEAAQLTQSATGVRLRILQELLPRPGDIQKGFSWPDPRDPRSEIIVLDKVVAGSSTKYFKDAFQLDVSPPASKTEEALVKEIAALPLSEIPLAIDAADAGGDAEDVVNRIREVVPAFAPKAEQLGAEGNLGGRIRPTFKSLATRTFKADGFELKVPLSLIDRVETHYQGGRYVTTIVTDTPLITGLE